MDGLLIIDKPAGPTSHDVVAHMRRALGERRIGHTGTLDPAATGLLCLVLGRATRLAQFLSNSDKSYEAVVRFGFATDTADAQGRATGPVSAAAMPSREAIEAALGAFRGTFLQQPPAFSAKKIDGKRSHKLARARARATNWQVSDAVAVSALPAPTTVSAYAIDIVAVDDETVTLRVDCSAGFYVRSLAHDLGEQLGVGAHLASLRRTRTGDFTVERAIAFEAAERDPEQAAAVVIPLAEMLPFPAVRLTADGVRRAVNGCQLGPSDTVPGPGSGDWGLDGPGESRVQNGEFRIPNSESRLFRLLDPAGALVGIARPASNPGLLHPAVVLM
jgi:tRNA pseudouridine55 synthase